MLPKHDWKWLLTYEVRYPLLPLTSGYMHICTTPCFRPVEYVLVGWSLSAPLGLFFVHNREDQSPLNEHNNDFKISLDAQTGITAYCFQGDLTTLRVGDSKNNQRYCTFVTPLPPSALFLLMILVQNFMLIKNHIETWVWKSTETKLFTSKVLESYWVGHHL